MSFFLPLGSHCVLCHQMDMVQEERTTLAVQCEELRLMLQQQRGNAGEGSKTNAEEAAGATVAGGDSSSETFQRLVCCKIAPLTCRMNHHRSINSKPFSDINSRECRHNFLRSLSFTHEPRSRRFSAQMHSQHADHVFVFVAHWHQAALITKISLYTSHLLIRTFTWVFSGGLAGGTQTLAFSHTAPPANVLRLFGVQCVSESSFTKSFMATQQNKGSKFPSLFVSISLSHSLIELRQNVGRLLITSIPALSLDQVNFECNVIDEILEQFLSERDSVKEEEQGN